MIHKIFNSKRKRSSLILSSVGSIIGLSIMLISLQLYFDINYLLSDDNGAINRDYIVIKKEISEMSMFQSLSPENDPCSCFNKNFKTKISCIEAGHKWECESSTTFSKSEIEELKKESFVNDLAPFKSCQYQVYAELGSAGNSFPGFATLAYFESVPDEFIDAPTKDWKWDESSEEIPIIMPTTFIDAYNFGIALSMGTPQISKNLLKSVRFKLHLKGNGIKTTYYGKVISLSDRVNSILVPEQFLDYTNKKFGENTNLLASRIIISTNNSKDPQIEKYLSENGYATNTEQIKGSQIQNILSGGLYYQFIISLIIVLQSVLLFIFYAQILVNKSEYEIKLLLLLGYKWNAIARSLNFIFLKIYILIILISFLILYLTKLFINYWFETHKSIDFPDSFNAWTFIIGITLMIFFILINHLSIRNKIIRLSK